MPLSTPILVAWGIVLGSILLIGGSLRALKRRRLMEDLPTSKTTGVFIGLVELKGTAESETPFTGFLSGERCVYYSWEVAEHYRRKSGKTSSSGSETVASGGESGPFYLCDDQDAVRIDPQRAKIIAETVFSRTCQKSDPLYYGKGPNKSVVGSTGSRTFTEKAIKLHKPIYVVGRARERTDCVAAEIAYDRLAPMFLISTKPEESLRSSNLWMFWIFGILAVILPVIVIAFVLLMWQKSIDDPHFWQQIALGLSFSAFSTWLIEWFLIVYNSLIGLKNRVKMAIANIDVELKRRRDLIPQLVSVVEGLQKHEREVQEAVALLRSQVAVQSVQNSTAQGCAGRIIGLAERYPELKANDVFQNLQDNLIKTEQRIALARSYYNDVIETYNNRRERFPESMIAVLARLRPVPPFVAEHFEREVVHVDLVR